MLEILIRPTRKLSQNPQRLRGVDFLRARADLAKIAQAQERPEKEPAAETAAVANAALSPEM